MAIVYLVWALFYSVFYAPSWVKNALAFKLNGGPQLVAQLNGAGFGFYNVQVDAENKFFGLSLSRQEITNGDLTYYWGAGARRQADETFRAYEKDRQEQFKHMVKLEKTWAIWAGLNQALGGRFQVIQQTINGLRINPKQPSWHLLSEFRFNNQSLVSIIGNRSGIGDPYDILIHLISRTLFIYPVLLLFAVAAAISPPQLADLIVYLPVLIYLYLLFLVSRRLFKR